ncbi:uncharacterized protein N7511_000875 [Penicillium nucicola]|uniref:uncharacterized protein n=1 Tax=Penicillium nucicola TaxID=1850975 RepID=UPI0025459A50|nr:uncharacterized protein N7511_000875 [Penicillium nucicola]KAJ5775864.1 hypothetical protein N7511_000875 [Penicillium nucicola]
MDPLFPVPERISSLMSSPRRQALTEHQNRSVSVSSMISDISMASVDSTAAEFLATKIEQLENETSYIAAIKAGMDEANVKGALIDEEYRKALEPYTIRIRAANSTLRVIKRQKHLLEDDLNETLAVHKRLRTDPPSDEGLLERAYKDTIVSRVMRAEGKQRALSFNHARFKKEVNKYYSTLDSDDGTLVWCHVLGGFFDKKSVKAAHIVPKSLDRRELAHMFGDEDAVVSLPQNGLSLHHKVESLLDRGDIAIVPMPGVFAVPTEWRCIVLNESLNMDIIYKREGFTIGDTPFILRVKVRPGNYPENYLMDLDNRPLKFLSDNRPRRRYLYMRFLISYLWCKREPVHGLERKVESNRFWPSAGAYIEHSTLQTLARCISGCEIPKNLTAEQTFERSNSPERNVTAGMSLAADLMSIRRIESGKTAGPDLVNAVTESMKRL